MRPGVTIGAARKGTGRGVVGATRALRACIQPCVALRLSHLPETLESVRGSTWSPHSKHLMHDKRSVLRLTRKSSLGAILKNAPDLRVSAPQLPKSSGNTRVLNTTVFFMTSFCPHTPTIRNLCRGTPSSHIYSVVTQREIPSP